MKRRRRRWHDSTVVAPVSRDGGRGDEGSAVVDFVLVGTLVVAVVVALMQVALVFHVRTVLIDAAGEGARRAALVGGTTQEAEQRVHTLCDIALAPGFVHDVHVTRYSSQGLMMVDVEIEAPLPLIGFLGPAGTLHVHGHAVDEEALIQMNSEEPRG